LGLSLSQCRKYGAHSPVLTKLWTVVPRVNEAGRQITSATAEAWAPSQSHTTSVFGYSVILGQALRMDDEAMAIAERAVDMVGGCCTAR